MISTYLSGAQPAIVVQKGLYAGLKSRKGLPTPLPLRIYDDVEYVNAGFIDGLGMDIVELLNTDHVTLRITHQGALMLTFYILMYNGHVLSFSDHQLIPAHSGICLSDIEVPASILIDRNVRMIFFKITADPFKHDTEDYSELIDWCYHGKIDHPQTLPNPFPLISRSLGDSPKLVKHYTFHLEHHLKLLNQNPDLFFGEIPALIIYESDSDAFELSRELVNSFSASYSNYADKIRVERNPYNLGGGGNMCLSVYNEMLNHPEYTSFGMLDSDTALPYKTLYLSSLLATLRAYRNSSTAEVMSPTIMYLRYPATILESGCLFGRGGWNVVSDAPIEPCILPLEHNSDLSDKNVQARIAVSDKMTDYPPFIFSIFLKSKDQSVESFLPSPFFLRGDDIELGMHLREQGIECKVVGSLVVFQDPKHSLWHELMAILHAVTIILAYAKDKDIANTVEQLSGYFIARSHAHESIRDLNGLLLYTNILERLIALCTTPSEQRIKMYFDPQYYLDMRILNSEFTEKNYILVNSLPADLPQSSFLSLPYLYFQWIPDCNMLPDKIGLINHMAKTAAIFSPSEVSEASFESAKNKFLFAVSSFRASGKILASACRGLFNRKQITSQFLNMYTLSPPVSGKKSTRSGQPTRRPNRRP